ncbi:MAG: hypothetical protein KAH22_01915 [Thiotrichaceae bacterium]|nr:hypothetical protein [Thiotrichaceae bacterium]
MKNIIPTYTPPLESIEDPVAHIAEWEKATDSYHEKKYKQSLIHTINYLNPAMLKDKDLDADIHINQMQGSAEIKLSVTDKEITIKAPFLCITDKTNKIALLRKIAEINFTPLDLTQIYLENNEVGFHYQSPIELAQPNKMYNILREIAFRADEYDDEFVSKYKADYLAEKKPKLLNEKEKVQAWQQIETIFTEYTQYCDFFTKRRWEHYHWDIAAISMLKISNMPYVNGTLRVNLIDEINRVFNTNIEFNTRTDKAKSYMKKLIAMPKEEIMQQLYHAEQFSSMRWRSSPKIIQEHVESYAETVKRFKNEGSGSGRDTALAYFFQHSFLKMIYNYNLEKCYKVSIDNVLTEVSGKTPEEATPRLTELYEAMLSGELDPKDFIPEHKTKKKAKKYSLYILGGITLFVLYMTVNIFSRT